MASRIRKIGNAGMAALVAFFAISTLAGQSADARTAWFGPGSGPVSPYKNYKGWAQVPRQPSTYAQFGRTPANYNTANYRPASNGVYHCVPNVGVVGPNGVCPD